MTLLTHSLAFMLGVAAAAGVKGPRDLWLALSAALLGLRLLRPQWQPHFFREPLRAHPLTAAALLAWGAARFVSSLAPMHDPGHVAYYAWTHPQGVVRVVGRVVHPPRQIDTNAWAVVLDVTRLRPIGRASDPSSAAIPLRGRVYVRITDPKASGWRYGDEVVARGRLYPLPSDKPGYRAYLARLGAGARLYAHRGGRVATFSEPSFWAWLYALRDRAHELVRHYWPAPEGPLFAGILLGLEDDIPESLYDAFRATGTAHIIVISGFNITVIAGLVIRLTGRLLGRAKGALAAALAIGLYTLLVGADPAVVRAALMGGLGLLARQVGRRQHGFTTLAFSAAVMVAVQPWSLWDIGFQLSFAATLGLMLYADPLSHAARRALGRILPARALEIIHPWIEEFFLLTLAAQILTLPLSAYYFQRISLVAWLANPLILPAQGPLMILGGLALLVGLGVEPLGQAVAWAAWPWAAFTIRVVEAFARLPNIVWHVGYGAPGAVVAVYALIAGLTWAGWKGRLRRLMHPGVAAVVLLAVDVLLWGRVQAAGDGRLHVWAWRGEGGPGVLIRFPGGARALVNGGSDPASLDHALGRILGPSTRQVDVWVIAANRDAHVGAVADLLPRYRPGWVWWLPGSAGGEPGYRQLRAALQTQVLPLTLGQEGASLTDGQAALSARQTQGGSSALQLTWKGFRADMLWEAPASSTSATVTLWADDAPLPWDVRITTALWVDASARGLPRGPIRAGSCVRLHEMGGVHVWTDGRTWGASTWGDAAPDVGCFVHETQPRPTPAP